MNPQLSPLGDRRERAVPCQRCRRSTWNIVAVCDSCLAKAKEEER